jgi:hypothetical protein
VQDGSRRPVAELALVIAAPTIGSTVHGEPTDTLIAGDEHIADDRLVGTRVGGTRLLECGWGDCDNGVLEGEFRLTIAADRIFVDRIWWTTYYVHGALPRPARSRLTLIKIAKSSAY